jgi:ribokinase
MKNHIVVIGSTNMDISVYLTHLPNRGETVLGGSLNTSLGGKGANQAVAASRLGADVTFITSIGNDPYGRMALEVLKNNSINTDFVKQTNEAPTGVALVMIGNGGENMIAVAQGANNLLTPEHIINAEPIIRNADCVLLQLEVPIATVKTAIEICWRNKIHSILNPAPAMEIPVSILQKVTTITPNEVESLFLAKCKIEDLESSMSNFRKETGINTIVMTLGKNGAKILGKNNQLFPSPQVKAKDTTAAGDAFNGALAVGLARHNKLEESVLYANYVAALSVTKNGAIDSLPYPKEVKEFILSIK